MQNTKHDPKTYVIYKVNFEGGGIWGIQQAVALAFIEELTGRPISEWFDVFEGASVGAIIAATLTMRDDVNPYKPKHTAKKLAQSFYPTALVLFKQNQRIMLKQAFNKLTERYLNRSFFNAHLDSAILEKSLRAFFDGACIEDALKTLIIPAHNMDRKKTVYFGHIKDDIFAPEALFTAPLIQSSSTLINAVMASTALPGWFPMHYDSSSGGYYIDIAAFMTPLATYEDFLNMARMRQRQFWAEPLLASRRDRMRIRGRKFVQTLRTGQALKKIYKGSAMTEQPKSLANTSKVVMRNIVFNPGDLSGLQFDRARQPNSGIFAHITPHRSYGFLNAAREHTRQIDESILGAEHNDEVRLATGKKAMTIITRHVIPDRREKADDYPSLNQTDGSHENLMRLYQFAIKYVLTNLDTIRSLLREIACEHLQRGQINKVEYERLNNILDTVTPDSAKKLLDTIVVNEENAHTFRAEVPDNTPLMIAPKIIP